MKQLNFQFQHIEIHQAGVLVLLFACEFPESYPFVESHRRDVSVNGDKAESRVVVAFVKYCFYGVDKFPANVPVTIV